MYNYLTVCSVKRSHYFLLTFRAVCFMCALTLGAQSYGQTSIVSLTPNYGTPSGNTAVAITGNNFLTLNGSSISISTVNFGSVPSANVIVLTNNTMSVVAPTQNAGIVDVVLTTNTGNVSAVVAADRFVYDTAPVYTNTISTQNVTVNTAYSTLNTALGVTDPDTAQTERWTLGVAPSYGTVTFVGAATANSGGSNIISTGQFVYTPNTAYTGNDSFTITVNDGYYTANQTVPVSIYPIPTVNSVSPTLTTINGGSTIQITGNFLNTVTGVSFGTTNAISYTINNANLITAVVPSVNTAGLIHVTVLNPATNSIASSSDQVRYDTAPTYVNGLITLNVTQNTAFTTANTALAVSDSDVGQTLTWSQKTAPSYGSLSLAGGSPGTTTAISGNSIITANGIISYTPNASYTGNDTFTVQVSDGYYTANQTVNVAIYGVPTVNGVTQNYGSVAGGNTISITGNYFTGATNVLFATSNAASFTVSSDHLITAVTPNAVAGVVDVKVVNPVATSAIAAADQFTYYNSPAVTALSTSNGTLAGGAVITLNGSYFTGASSVLFGTTPATSFTVNSDSLITAVEPNLGAGSFNVVVTTKGGASTANAANLLTTYAIPTISAISTNNGPVSGGTPIVITGANFNAVSSVNFGTTAVASFSVDSSTQISTLVPAGAVSTVDIFVTTPGGKSASSVTDQYAYYTAPILSWSNPADIIYPTALSSTQLNASATSNSVILSGNYAYTPPLGTVLTPGVQTLNVIFTPNDSVHYTTVNASVRLNVNSSPTITAQPQTLTVAAGSTANFAVTASAVPAPAYQWLYNGAPISGATTANYSVANVQTANAGNYSVFVSNGVNSILSSTAVLTVTYPNALPAFSIQPASQVPVTASNVTLVASATGNPSPTYQWYFNSSAISGATNPSYFISNAQPSNSGSYYVVASNSIGSTKSASAFVLINPLTGSPTFSSQPASQSVINGSSVVFRANTASASATLPTYQWYLNGYAIAGATSSSLLTTATAGNLGNYQCIVTTSNGAALSSTASLTTTTTSNPGRLTNLSALTLDGSGNKLLTLGFVTGGVGTSGNQALLLRGIGPALAPLGVTNVLPDPSISLFNGSTLVNSNTGWGSTPANIAQVTAANTAVGAFVLTNNASLDSAMAVSLTPSPYTMQVSSKSNTTGNALAEVYDYTPAGTYTATTPRLMNLSCLQQVVAGGMLSAGFTISGTTSKTVLIRASGPVLATFNIASILPVMIDPTLSVFSGSTVLATNSGWGGDSAISAAATAIGAFAFPSSTSTDSAVLITLAAGNYTVQVKSVSGVAGSTMIEIFEVP
jgi:large repetitive protein